MEGRKRRGKNEAVDLLSVYCKVPWSLRSLTPCVFCGLDNALISTLETGNSVSANRDRQSVSKSGQCEGCEVAVNIAEDTPYLTPRLDAWYQAASYK